MMTTEEAKETLATMPEHYTGCPGCGETFGHDSTTTCGTCEQCSMCCQCAVPQPFTLGEWVPILLSRL
jgi:hypothetical protein